MNRKEKSNLIVPRGLTNLVNPNDIEIVGYGRVFKSDLKEVGEEYNIYTDNHVSLSVNCFNASKEYIQERGLQDKDKIAFVEYPLNGRKIIDIIKRK